MVGTSKFADPPAVIRLLRALHGLSQRQAAMAAGIAPDRFWRFENGVATPRRDEARRLGETLIVPISSRPAATGVAGRSPRGC